MQTSFKQSKTASGSVRDVGAPIPAVSWQPKIESRQAKRKKIHWPPLLFLVALVVPWLIFIGTVRLSVYRIVLLVMVLPCLGMWMAGKAGRIRIADIALLLFWFWCSLSIIVRDGMVIVNSAIRHLVRRNPRPLSVGAMLHPGRGRFLQCGSANVQDCCTLVPVRHR